MTALSMMLTLAAFALFGLSVADHQRRRLRRLLPEPTVRRMRIAAWIALLVAFPPAIAAQGWVFGPILWVALLMLGAGLVFLALNLLPVRQK